MANEQSDASSFVKSMEEKIGRSTANENLVNCLVEVMVEGFPSMVVPDVVRQQNVDAYSPTIVSIGPLHRGKDPLKAMEPVKLSYTRALFERTHEAFDDTLKTCAEGMLELAKSPFRNIYESLLLDTNDSFAEVMLLDGCFIIELLWKNFEGSGSEDSFDSILSNPFKCYAVRRDLLLLENQIPFKVLEVLFDEIVTKIPKKSNQEYSLAKWVLLFFGNIMGLENYEYVEDEEPFHILHLLHTQYKPRNTDNGDTFTDEEGLIKYSATELRLAGVQLKAAGKGKKGNLFDIKFTTACSCSCFSLFSKGHLEITPFSISESTESFLRNLIAFELNCPYIKSCFTSFAFFMDLLINTPEDVKLLEEANIIRNSLGSGKEVARLFNGICNNATSGGFYHVKEYKQALDFCKPWRVSSGRFKHYYFGSPWSGISVIAAFVLFVLTFISTLYTMLSYHEAY